MRVLLYCDDPGYGGTSINASLLAAGLANKGFTICLTASSFLNLDMPGVTFWSLGYDTQRQFEKTLYSRNEPEAAFLDFRPDIVLFCDCAPDSSLAAKTVCRDWRLPYAILVNYVAPSHIQTLACRREAIIRAYSAALVVVAVSVENLWLLRTWFCVSSENSLLIHYGRPVDFFTPVTSRERELRRESLGIRPDDVLYLTVGRYEPRKGYQHLLAALHSLAYHPLADRMYFIWIGHSWDGKYEKSLADHVNASCLPVKVAILSQCNDIRGWLAAADVFILPSESEGMPLSVIEAMGQGLPIITTAVSGIPEQIGNTGILVADPTQDADATVNGLVRAITTLAQDPQKRHDFGRAAMSRARLLFTAETMVANYADLFSHLHSVIESQRPVFPCIEAYQPPNAVLFGKDLEIGDDKAAIEFLRDGWGHAETKGRWTIEERATMSMFVGYWGAGLVLSMKIKPFLGSSNGTMKLEIRCNHQVIGKFSWTGEAKSYDIEFAIFPVNSQGTSKLLLEFIISGASSPFSHGLSNDMRQLGVWVSHFHLEKLT